MKQLCYIGALLALLLTSCQKSKEEIFAREASELTQQCPITIDACTSLDSLVYDRGNALFQYCYSVQGYSDIELTAQISSPSFTEGIKNNVLNSVEMKPYKEAGLTFVYRYYSKQSKQLLGSIVVGPETYRQP